MVTGDKLKALLAAAIVACFATPTSAQADHREDVFSVRTPSTPKLKGTAAVHIPAVPQNAGPRVQISTGANPVEWFGAFDTYINFYKPKPQDRFVMNQPFNQEVERVNEFCSTTARLAKNYRILARKLASLPVPHQVPQVQQYRDMHVKWYNDTALLYEDMIRPRPPAKTKEELAATIKELKDRSESLTESFGTLQIMDLDLRKQYHVRLNDALTEYTTSPTR